MNSNTVTGLTPGTYYDFVVEARNIKGLSVYSDSVTILAAQIPDSPENLANDPLVTDAH